MSIDLMNLGLLTEQRPGIVLKMRSSPKNWDLWESSQKMEMSYDVIIEYEGLGIQQKCESIRHTYIYNKVENPI